jgi:16S rRNA (cytosine967-C5)-methyltransferase
MGPQEAAALVLAELLATMPGAREGAPAPKSTPDAGNQPADQRLREFFRRHPGLGKRDRLQVGDLVFDVLRNLRLYRAIVRVRSGGETDAADHVRELTRVAAQANGVGGVAGAEELQRFASGQPEAVRYSLPDWLWDRLQAAHGARAGAIAAALLLPSPIDLRANLLKGKADVLRRLLLKKGIDAAPIDDAPTGLRVSGHPGLEQLDLFQQGWFEIQDAGSQRIADACGARRGQLVVDFCAGGGGKSLAIAARMRNLGKVLAFDTVEERLARLKPRASRAGIGIIETMRIDGVEDPRLARYRSRADVVLVDVPCSGTGTLRRSPDTKWRLSPKRLLAHVEEQQAILRAASSLVKPGGTLAYATCSLLREENEAQVERFDEGRWGRHRFDPRGTTAWLPDEGPSSSFFMAKWVLQARS